MGKRFKDCTILKYLTSFLAPDPGVMSFTILVVPSFSININRYSVWLFDVEKSSQEEEFYIILCHFKLHPSSRAPDPGDVNFKRLVNASLLIIVTYSIQLFDIKES